MTTIVERFHNPPGDVRAALCADLHIEPGALRDYKTLARFHYRGGRPAAVTAVDRLVRNAPSVVGRYFTRPHNESQVIGVIVRTLPPLDCALRNVATCGRYTGLDRTHAARLVNAEVRTIARVVLDPTWRGLGLAVRLVRHVLNHPQTIYTEALAAMGRMHPFFARAGMKRYDRPPLPTDQRLLDALEQAGIAMEELAAPRRLAARIHLMERPARTWLLRELARWGRTAAGRQPRNSTHHEDIDRALDLARKRLLSQPVYYLVRHEEDRSTATP